jgi:hypothetical protein
MLRERVNTFLGTLLLCSVALWAGITMWQAATGNNPLVQAFEKTIPPQVLYY